MFSKKIDAADAQIATLTAVIEAVGLTAEATPETATAHIAQLQADAAAQAATSLDEQIASLSADLVAAKAVNASLVSGLKAAGVELAADTEPTADSIKTAIGALVETKVTAQAARVVAQSGHEPLAVAAGGDDVVDDIEGVREQLRTETDPVKRGKLAAQAKKLREQSKTAARN